MGRKIFVSSDISVDDRIIDVAAQDQTAGLMWPWMLTAFDDWGRCEASPKRLKAQVFPAFPGIHPSHISKAISLYCQVGLVTQYETAGRHYLAIDKEKWFRYQTHIHSSKRTQDNSKYPAPTAVAESKREAGNHVNCLPVGSAESREIPRTLSPSPSPSPSLSLSTLRRNECPKRQGKSKTFSPAFEGFWTVYPRKVAKLAACKAWDAQVRSGVPEETLQRAAHHYSVAMQGTDDRFILHASTFLGTTERWRDYIDPRPPQPTALPAGITSIMRLVNDVKEGRVQT